MSKYISGITHAVKDPVVPYNSLYIDIPLQDLYKAFRTPSLLSSIDCFNPRAYDPSIKCFGCRVRQIYGITRDAKSSVFESVNDIHQRLAKLSWSKTYAQEESMNSIHYDIAALWARPWINNSMEYQARCETTKQLAESNPLCSLCTLSLHKHTITSPPPPPPQQQQQQQQQPAQKIPQGLKDSLTATLSSTPITSVTPPQSSFPAISQYMPPPHAYNVVMTLSVRSALSAWLLYKNFPKGNIVLFSAINIPDMARVIRAHGLIPLPIDLDTNTTMINMDILEKTIQHYGSFQQEFPTTPSDHPITQPFSDEEDKSHPSKQPIDAATGRATTPKVCAVILSYIWGIRNDIASAVQLTHKYDIPCIEDCAEAYTDANFTGHPDADMSLFSFGSIKNATAFGGGIARIKSFEDYYGVLIQQSLWPRFTNQQYYEKVRKMAPLAAVLNYPTISTMAIRGGKAVNVDVKELMVSNLRGFPGDMIIGIRHQPSQALTYMLRHRLAKATTEDLSLAAQKGFQFEQLVAKHNIYMDIAGKYAKQRGYWLFPFIVCDPDGITQKLNDRGVQIYRGATQLKCLPLPEELEPKTVIQNGSDKNESFPMPFPVVYAAQVMQNVIYLPLNKHIPFPILESMAKECAVVCGDRDQAGGRSIIDYPPVKPEDVPNLPLALQPEPVAFAKL